MAREYADPYVYQGTGVLINRAGIRDENAFKTFEYQQTDSRSVELSRMPLPAKFDFDHLKSIHSTLFRDVYEWSGTPRTIDLSKGGTTFERVQNIEAAGARISNRIQEQNNLQGLDKREFVEKVSGLFTDLNALHPFREGNGRATREFIGQVARGAGYELDQTRIDNDKSQWNKAAAQSVHGELGAIKEIFSQAIRPSRAVAFETLPREAALQRHPELQRTFADMDTLQKTLTTRYPGNQKAQDHFLSQARTEAVRKLDQGGAMEIAPPREGQQPTAPTVQRTEDKSLAGFEGSGYVQWSERALREEHALLSRNQHGGPEEFADRKKQMAEIQSELSRKGIDQVGGKDSAQHANPVAGEALGTNNELKSGATSRLEQTSAYRLSLTAIDDMAKTQGLTANDPAKIGNSYRGEVVGVSEHHTLVKVSDGVGVRHENDTLSRAMNVGERVKLDLENPRTLERGANAVDGRGGNDQVKAAAGHDQGKEAGGRAAMTMQTER